MFLLAIVSLVGTSAAHAEPFAYVTNAYSDNVSVIDTATNTVIATVPVSKPLTVSQSRPTAPTPTSRIYVQQRLGDRHRH